MKRSSSIETTCVICLDLIHPKKKCRTSCFHEFCYDCIREWLKYHEQCPLCKRRLEHDDVKSPSTTNFDSGYCNESGSCDDTSSPQSSQSPQSPQSPLPFIHTQKMRSLFGYDSASIGLFVERNCLYDERIPKRSSVEWRSFCYEKNLWAVLDPPEAPPHQSLHFYRQNPGRLPTLRIWLDREMKALAEVVRADVKSHPIDIVMSGVEQCNIDSERFRDFLPTLEPKTKHFIHELISFANSMHNSSVEEYDANVKYDFRIPRNTWSDGSSESQTSSCSSSSQSDIDDYIPTEMGDNSEPDAEL